MKIKLKYIKMQMRLKIRMTEGTDRQTDRAGEQI